MDDKIATITDVLELLWINQHALGAACEEVSTWVRQRGSVDVHESVVSALNTLDVNAEAIRSAINTLRH